MLEAVVSANSEMAGHDVAGARYEDVLDSLRTAYDGTSGDDLHEPAGFFSWRTDEQIRRFVTQYFTLFDFHVIAPGRMHFQALTLRCPA